ncbi:MAG: M14 family metallopeptidase [Gemmatimonadota bacterium]|nr:M14 family metallopeptidase [Gemmatimonadota bacterium]
MPSPSTRARSCSLIALVVSSALASGCIPAASVLAQGPTVPTPQSMLGYQVGADRKLADWNEILGYFGKLAAASPAVSIQTLGQTTMGKPLIAAIISTPENVRNRDAIFAAQRSLADPRILKRADEVALYAHQPAVLVIQCNIHSDEIASSQMAMELAYRLATNDTLQAELKNTVVILIPSVNPDGEEMVVQWYRSQLGTKWEGGDMPWIYNKYTGHDDNRDWFMMTQIETRLVTHALYKEWLPEIFYDVHQQGSEGSRLFVPPFLDPVDPNIDPLIVRGIGLIGAEMASALESRGKAGVVDHAVYDMWWDGGARSTPARHNMMGLLTEAASVKVATPIVQVDSELTGHERGLPKYERSVNFPNPWKAGLWTLRDIVDYELIASEALVHLASSERERYVRDFVTLGRREIAMGESDSVKAWEIPIRQRDPGAAVLLANKLELGGIEVSYTDSSIIVPMAQPFRAHAKDLLEVQHYPKRLLWPGGPPEQPYDVTGWTLPLQMGVVAWPLASIPHGGATEGREFHLAMRAGEIDARHTNEFATVDSILRARHRITVNASIGTNSKGGSYTLKKLPRIAIYRPWTGNMDEGWCRWVLEQFHLPYVSLTDSGAKAGKLRDHFDVLLVPDMSLREMRDGNSAMETPPQYAGGLGTAGIAAIREFVTNGGTLVLLDHASELATESLGVPVKRIVVPRRLTDESRSRAPGAGENAEPLYAPGSILRVLVDTTNAISYGMPDTAAVYFTNSVTFDVGAASQVRVIARYPNREEDILLSGYLQGASQIAGKAAAISAPVGRGHVVMFGFRPQHRGQSYGTFRMLFNALLTGGASATRN